MIWYQINPAYFIQIAIKQKWIDVGYTESFYQLVNDSINNIKNLNCDGIWLMPLYNKGYPDAVGGGSPYAVKNFNLNTAWGTKEELLNLTKSIHDSGLKIITEFIPNHMAQSSDFIAEFSDCAYRGSNGNLLYDQDWGDTVKLLHTDPRVQSYIAKNMQDIIGLGFDGFRLDMSHYPFYSINERHEIARINPDFWKNILNKMTIDYSRKYFVGEIYDDRNKSYYGYGDHIELFKNNISAYDKKSHDILVFKLKDKLEGNLQLDFYSEMMHQKEAAESARRYDYPYLRFGSNHDDAPAIQNFGGIRQYICALAILFAMPGHTMLYAGDEYGLSVKPSVTGQVKQDGFGNLVESNEISFIENEDQKFLYQNIQRICEIRKKLFNDTNFLICSIDTINQNRNDILVLMNYSKESKKVILTAINTSQSNEKIWAHVNWVLTENEKENKTFKNIILEIFPEAIDQEVNVKNLLTNEELGKRALTDDFIIGLEGLEVQILSLTF